MDNTAELTEIFGPMLEKLPKDRNLQIPPPVYEELGNEFVDFDAKERTLVTRFPVQKRYQNPLGLMQGGVVIAAMDNTLGPLSYLVAPPSVTTQMNTTFLKPISPRLDHIRIEAKVIHQSRRQVIMEAKALSADGQVLVLCQCTNLVLEG